MKKKIMIKYNSQNSKINKLMAMQYPFGIEQSLVNINAGPDKLDLKGLVLEDEQECYLVVFDKKQLNALLNIEYNYESFWDYDFSMKGIEEYKD